MISQSSQTKDNVSVALDHSLMQQMTIVLRPLVRWAMHRGLGHSVISRWLKPLFLQESQQVLKERGIQPTDSAVALAAGLHRADIHQLRSQQGTESTTGHTIPITHQVLANWVLAGLPATIPFKSVVIPLQHTDDIHSFTDLVHHTPKAASQGFSARLLLQDMVRQGLVAELPGDNIQLQDFSSSTQMQSHQSLQHLSQAAHDLFSAGLHNIQSNAKPFLEQSLEVDGLHPDSVNQLHDLATEQWHTLLQNMLPQSQKFSSTDEAQGGTHRLRLGIYFYAEPMAPTPPS